MRARGAMKLAVLALAAAAAFAHHRMHRLRAESGAAARAALESVLTPAEVVGITLLGGFRSLAINMVWLRLLERLEDHRFQELPVLHAALEVLQGRSPSLYLRLSDQMVLDIPARLPHRPEERWAWVRRGLEVLERGRRRFPGNLLLLRQAEYLYYVRFHPQRSPLDRQRFLAEPRREGVGVEYGRDPLQVAREAAEEALLDPAHPFDVDFGLWAIYRLAYGLTRDAEGKEGGPGARELLDRARRLLAHARAAHPGPEVEELLWEWRRQIDEEMRLGGEGGG
jgi:hypothetical protein